MSEKWTARHGRIFDKNGSTRVVECRGAGFVDGDEMAPVEVAENRRSANVLRGAGWVETPEGWRSGSAAPLPLIEAFAELLRQMKSSP